MSKKDTLYCVIPFRTDHVDRWRNLQICLHYYSQHPTINCHFIVVEDDYPSTAQHWPIWSTTIARLLKEKRLTLLSLPNAAVAHQTRAKNWGAFRASQLNNFQNFVLGFFDSDIIISYQTLEETFKYIQSEARNVCWASNGLCYNLYEINTIARIAEFEEQTSSQKIWEILQQTFLTSQSDRLQVGQHNEVFERWSGVGAGGIIFFNSNYFWSIGAWNEYFRGWGYEDSELFARVQILSPSLSQKDLYLSPFLDSSCVAKMMFHIAHRGAQRHNFFLTWNEQLCKKTQTSNIKQLQQEIQTWPWHINRNNYYAWLETGT